MPRTVTVSVETLHAGAQAALANARRLLGDAQTLLQAGSSPTAHSLAILAMEEATKAVNWRGQADDATGDEVTVTERTHRQRLADVRRVLSYLKIFWNLRHDPDYEQPTDEAWLAEVWQQASGDNATKQRGFYVDVEPDEVLEPSLLAADQAKAAVKTAESVTDLAAMLLASRHA